METAETDPVKEQSAAALELALKRQLRKLSREDLERLARQTRNERSKALLDGPQNPEELHSWIRTNLGVNIPRVAVCKGHTSPFEFLCELYFERTDSALAIANRGGSKTYICALWHLLNSEFKPGTESASVGAVENQARRAYLHLGKMLDMLGTVPEKNRTTSETNWPNGSRVEILPGTVNAVNGPHPQKVHADEVELMDPQVYDESRNMSASMTLPSGKIIKAQDVITSTRKRVYGPIQKLLDEVENARKKGLKPPHDVFTWCIFETAARVPNCVVANPGCENPCPCKDIVKGEWEDGSARSLADVCNGRLAKSDGWIPLNDIIKRFLELPRRVWEAQQECKKPMADGLVAPGWMRERHCIPSWTPHPELGPIYFSIDFGGTNPHAAAWYQLVREGLHIEGLHGRRMYIPKGALIVFSEIYKANIGNNAMKKLVIQREVALRKAVPGFKVSARFGDPQAKAAMLDYRSAPNPLDIQFKASRDVKWQVGLVNEMLECDVQDPDDPDAMMAPRLFVVESECPMFIEEIEAWHYPDPRAGMVDDPEIPVDDFDHQMSALRYVLANIASLQRLRGKGKSVPKTAPRSGPKTNNRNKIDGAWRGAMGHRIGA